jgi:hypothetical protein
MTEITGTATRHSDEIRVEVAPGGALSSISLSDKATTLGPTTLAAAVVDAVAEATARANQRTKSALRDALAGLDRRDLAILGLDQDETLTERVETTTPRTWRQP